MNNPTFSIATAIDQVTNQIRDFESRHGREPGSVQLLAVSKTKPISAIREAMSAGQSAFGENYLEEAAQKIAAIDHAQWHFIGGIQSRKTTEIAELFDWVHSVDRQKIAQRLADTRTAEQPRLNICLQVNIDNEASKSGVSAEELPALADFCAGLPTLSLRGLMAIPAPRDTLSEQRQVLSHVHALFKTLQASHPSVDTLSMGMSGDLEAAIAEGATMVRIGTAVFGARS